MLDELIGWTIAIADAIYCCFWFIPLFYILIKVSKRTIDKKSGIEYIFTLILFLILFYALTYPIANKILYLQCFLYPLIQYWLPSLYLNVPFLIIVLYIFFSHNTYTKKMKIITLLSLLTIVPLYYLLTFNFVWQHSNDSFKFHFIETINLILDCVCFIAIMLISSILIDIFFDIFSKKMIKKEHIYSIITFIIIAIITLPFGIDYAVLMSKLFKNPQISIKLETYSQKVCIFNWQKKLLYKFSYNLNAPCKIE